MGLNRAWPLERRLRREACEATRETYTAVLLRWQQTGSSPVTHGFDHDALEELTALDAIFLSDGHIGCPPFSAVPTDIQVHCPHETLHALSALDALALPRVVGAAATIEARCAMSGAPIQVTLNEAGELPSTDLDCARVVFAKVASQVIRYVFDLAPGIRFVRPESAAGLRQTLSLAEALAVANSFYAFQRKMLGLGCILRPG